MPSADRSDLTWGLYVHVPWCRIRCPYCAFHVVPDRGDAPFEAYVDRVLAEVSWRSPHFPGPPSTIYLGGGTPSRLPPRALARLLDHLPTSEAVEVTVEANPEDVDPTWIAAATAAGVTRVSLGTQSLDERIARKLGRAHTPAEARRAAAMVADAFPTWSLDLMFALPGQSQADLEDDVEAALALDPPHVSLYGLTLEPGTPFARAHDQGRLQVPDDEVWRSMYAHLVHRLGEAGRHRYEVSNFARTGHEAVHNSGYWEGRPYMGVGPSAHGLLPDGTRYANVADTPVWLARQDPTESVEPPDPQRTAQDAIISGLRAAAGVDLDAIAARTGWRPAAPAVHRLIAGGMLETSEGRTRLAAEGFYVADAVTAAVVDALAAVDHPVTRR